MKLLRLRWYNIIVILGLLCLIAYSFSHLFQREHEDYAQMRDLVRQMQTLHKRLNEQVLKVNSGVSDDYQAIQQTHISLQEKRLQLNNLPFILQKSDPQFAKFFTHTNDLITQTVAGLTDDLNEYNAILTRQLQLVDEFKTDNNIMRDSLTKFPVISQDMSSVLMFQYKSPRMAQNLNEISHNLLTAILSSRAPDFTHVRALIDNLISQDTKLNETDQNRLFDALDHADIIMVYQQKTADLTDDILSIPATAILEKIYDGNRVYYEAVTRNKQLYRFIVYIGVLGILLYFLYNIGRVLLGAQNSAESSREEMQAVLNTVVEGIITIDSNGKIRSVNPSAGYLFDYTPDQLIGEDFTDLLETSSISMFEQYIESNVQFPDKFAMGFESQADGKRKDASIFPIEFSINRFDLYGEPTFVCSIRDVTARQQSEAEMAMYTNELEMAKIAADQANVMKSLFLATMSHEIRTPMNGLVGMAELLLETKLTLQQKKYARVIIDSADTLLTIINDILDFSKIEAGRMELDHAPVDLMQLVSDSVALVTPRIYSKNVEIMIRYVPGTPRFFMGDAVRIRQIMANLVSNAIKFTEKGYILVTVAPIPDFKLKEDDAHKIPISLSIQDTGIGISPDAQNRIFEKFSQADASTTRQYGGTGLGLTICQELAQLMGGDIALKSTLGFGSTFTVSLLLEQDKDKANQDGANIPEKLVDLFAHINDTRILLIDEDEVSHDLIAEKIRFHGARLHISEMTSDAIKALKKASKGNDPFQLVIINHSAKTALNGDAQIDKLSPGLDAYNVIQDIKKDKDLENIHAIILTSHDDTAHQKKAKECGFSGFIRKPILGQDLEILLAHICEHIHQTSDNKGKKDSYFIHTDEIPRFEDILPNEVKFNNLRVLLAEDDRTNQQFITQVLEDAGCKVHLATNGRQAVDMVQAKKIDLIFMDCEMPEMDGYEASKAITKLKIDKKIKEIPIIAISGHALDDHKDKVQAANMNDILVKPVRKNDLLNMLRKWASDKLKSGNPSSQGTQTIDTDSTDNAILSNDDSSSAQNTTANASDPLTGKHILLVDDNRINRMISQEMLEGMGCTVDTAENGEDAVESALKTQYDLILMDMQMPIMDGYTAMGILRDHIAQDVLKRMPIIALTASAMKGDREKCLDAGADDYITKPVKKAALKSIITKWLSA